MNIIDIILKKVYKKELTKEEINFFIDGYLNSSIKAYQVSALLMAIRLNGMSDNETYNLTNSLKNSGEIINLDQIDGITLDKHSTGGIGDKTTLILGPIVASLGAKMAKMSGRGLGNTGGTIDKLDSIKGFTSHLHIDKFISNVKKHGLSIMAQSNEIAPADGRLYALRDVTGSVSSIPLIVSSIMSKKLAIGTDAILLDIKCGNGAFMHTMDDAIKLANQMISIGKKFNKDIRAYITNMSIPLGRSIGNKIEILEVIDFLKGNHEEKLYELIINLSSTLLIQAKIFNDKEIAIKHINETLSSGKALKKFYEFIKAQNGDIEHLNSPSFFKPKYKYSILAKKDGYMHIIDALKFGMTSSALGAGRIEKDDKIDMDAGIYINKLNGEKVLKDEIIITLYSSHVITSSIIKKLDNSYKIEKYKYNSKIILKELG